MDSILVADMNRHVFIPKPFQQPSNIHLEKRPTFDNIDKRASWSLDKSLYPGPVRYPVYPTPVLHHQVGLPVITAGGKKPVPLPRSKIPLPTTAKAATIERSVQPELRTFKRSKTDLSLVMLNSYKASRAGQEPPAREPSSPNRSQPKARRPSTNRANGRPSVIREEQDKGPVNALRIDLRQKESLHILEKSEKAKKGKPVEPTRPVKPVEPSRTEKGKSIEPIRTEKRKPSDPARVENTDPSPKTPPKPAIKEKPWVPVIKSTLNFADKELAEKQRRLIRAQSESDIISRLEVPDHHLVDAEAQTLGNYQNTTLC